MYFEDATAEDAWQSHEDALYAQERAERHGETPGARLHQRLHLPILCRDCGRAQPPSALYPDRCVPCGLAYYETPEAQAERLEVFRLFCEADDRARERLRKRLREARGA